ncbi:MAG: protein translocase SEC61 complex subunit gamma [Candidatus Woesearchaeota archaeon]
MDEEKKQELPEEQKIPEEKTAPIMPSEVPAEIQKEPEQIAQPTQVFVPKTVAGGEAKPSRWQKVKDFLVECRRVLRVTKKPDKVEFKTIVKISGIGIVAIGFIGFLVHFLKELIF